MQILKQLTVHPERKNLVVVRAGANSLHNSWLRDCSQTRNWDLLVSYYDAPNWATAQNYEGCVFQQGNKLKPLHDYYTWGWFDSYDYVWLPDPDIATDGKSINTMFELMRVFDLSLAQPCLSDDSFTSHPITKRRADCVLRFTNFVEVMLPCFSKAALAQCVPTFLSSNYMWGVDYLWAKTLDYPQNKIAILDCLPMQHTNPVGSSYDIQAAYREMFEILGKYEIAATQETYGVMQKP